MVQKRSFAEIKADFDQGTDDIWTETAHRQHQRNINRQQEAKAAMAYFHGPCDSYFVEPHDERGQSYRESLRERERHAKHQTQLAIAEELSQLASAEYCQEILEAMESMELKTLPDVASIEIQTEIQWFMRPYLLDFLIEAHTAFGLLPETLFLAVNLLDRYCSKRIVYKRHYQLVGCSALLIAAKYGDRKDRVPTIKELKCMCCSLYDDDMFTQMEWHVLQTLGWVVGHPTVDSFLQLALDGLAYDPEVEHMACYISEIAMFHKDFISKRSSDMARASLALARCILNRPQAQTNGWTSNYEAHTLVTLSQHLHGPSKVLSRKYSTAHLSRVAITLETFLARQASIARGSYAPPTPPTQNTMASFGKAPAYNVPVTPTKQQYRWIAPNNTLTPPITPTNLEYSGSYNNPAMGNHNRPATPQSMESQSSLRYNTQYSLPPIRSLAPMQ